MIVNMAGGRIVDEISWGITFQGKTGGEMKLAHESPYLDSGGWLTIKPFHSVRFLNISVKSSNPVLVSLVVLPHEDTPLEKGKWGVVACYQAEISPIELSPSQWFALHATKWTSEEADVLVTLNGLLRKPVGK
jgi:hypothetical protein